MVPLKKDGFEFDPQMPMTPGTRQHGPATLKLSYSTVVPAHLRGNLLEVTNVHTPEDQRGKGYGSMLLQKVCTEADENAKVLMLTADTKELAEWYATFGFNALQAKPVVLMARKPGSLGVAKLKPLAFAMGVQ